MTQTEPTPSPGGVFRCSQRSNMNRPYMRARRRAPAGRQPDSEADLQARIVELLARYGWLVLESDKAAMGRTVKKGAYEEGFPDLLALKGDRFILLEFKAETGRIRPEQEAFRSRVAQLNAITVHVVRSEAELTTILRRRTA